MRHAEQRPYTGQRTFTSAGSTGPDALCGIGFSLLPDNHWITNRDSSVDCPDCKHILERIAMNKVKITRAGGYDPKLGPNHPNNQDPTLVESKFDGNKLTRSIVMSGADNMGLIRIDEIDDDTNVITIDGVRSVRLDATRLWNLAAAIVELYGGQVLRSDDKRARTEGLRGKIFDVLVDNESRCLDDNIDRDVVLRELMKVLSA